MKNTQQAGYYRFPTIHNDKIAFVAEDDLWMVAADGGTALCTDSKNVLRIYYR